MNIDHQRECTIYFNIEVKKRLIVCMILQNFYDIQVVESSYLHCYLLARHFPSIHVAGDPPLKFVR